MRTIRRLHRLGTFFLCFAFFCSVGGHWAILQSVAWVEMFKTYSQTKTLAVAAEKTFDGKHPCEVCNRIEHAKKRAEKSTPILPLLTLKFHITARPSFTTAVFARELSRGIPRTRIFMGTFALGPPTPPPRISESLAA